MSFQTTFLNSRHGVLLRLAAVLAVAYATLAGFHTLSDFDIWWQLASGRWMWDHGAVLRQETFSYTAPGAPWTYPAAGEILFYWIYRQGGLALLSLLTPLACLAVSLLLIRKGGMLRAWGVAIAAPFVAWRAFVRADMFTTVFAAIFLAVLWENHCGEKETRRWLWILPPLMAIWVNLHPGFMFGLALMALFTFRHPRRLMPCTVLAALATLANPWGWRIYFWLGTLASLLPLPQFMQMWLGKGSHPASGPFIGELARTPISFPILSDSFRWRDPDSGLWWLMALALAAIAVGLFRGKGWGPLLLVCSIMTALAASRFQAVFAIATVIVAPDLLSGAGILACRFFFPNAKSAAKDGYPAWTQLLMPVSALLLLAFVAVRVTDLATNRTYVMQGEIHSFGAGVAEWFPERACQFIRQNRLPRELYGDYNSGGFLTWSLAPEYPVFTDGRNDPYGSDLFFLDMRLRMLGPDSDEWRNAIAKYKIHTVLIPVWQSGNGMPMFKFCNAPEFRLAYLDDTAAVFVDAPSLPDSLKGSSLDCRTAVLTPPPPSAPAWDRWEFYSNAGKLYYTLERDWEAEQAWLQALAIFPDDPSMHMNIGQLRRHQRRLPETEREFRRAIELRPTAGSWAMLGDLLLHERRASEAMECFRESALRAAHPEEAWLGMAGSARAARRPLQALEAANRALEANPFVGVAASTGSDFVARALAARGAALLDLGRVPEAIDSLESAVHMPVEPPLSADLRRALANAYGVARRPGDARRTLDEARKLGASGRDVDALEKQIDALEKQLEPGKPR